MKAQPVLLLKPSGEVAIPLSATDLAPLASDANLAAILAGQVKVADLAPLVRTADLAPLATEARLAALLAAVSALPQPNTKITEVTMSLAAPVIDTLVPLGHLLFVEKIIVKSLAGATATLKLGAFAQTGVPIVAGEVRNNLNASLLYLNSPGGVGGTITLELQGR